MFGPQHDIVMVVKNTICFVDDGQQFSYLLDEEASKVFKNYPILLIAQKAIVGFQFHTFFGSISWI